MIDETPQHVIYDRRKGWFDPKITLGNLLTVLGMLIAIMLAWGQLDKQQEILRTRFELYQQSNEKEKAIKETLEKIDRKLDELDRKLEAKTTALRRQIG